ncbi:MAG: hypothetical protein WCH61_00820 [bacterium]
MQTYHLGLLQNPWLLWNLEFSMNHECCSKWIAVRQIENVLLEERDATALLPSPGTVGYRA